MSDTSTVSPETPTEQSTTEPADTTDWKTEAEKLRTELQKARKWEDRAKENARAAQRLAEIEGPQKTELDKALERAAAAELRVAEFETRDQVQTWKTEIATATGVPANYLRGSTQEELQAHAEELKPVFETRGPVVPTVGQIPSTTPSDDRQAARELFGSSN